MSRRTNRFLHSIDPPDTPHAFRHRLRSWEGERACQGANGQLPFGSECHPHQDEGYELLTQFRDAVSARDAAERADSVYYGNVVTLIRQAESEYLDKSGMFVVQVDVLLDYMEGPPYYTHAMAAEPQATRGDGVL